MKIYCYAADSAITTTTITYSGNTYSLNYNKQQMNIGIYEVSDGTEVTFSAATKRNRCGVKWIYRMGSPSSPQGTRWNNADNDTSFICGTQDLYIRAEVQTEGVVILSLTSDDKDIYVEWGQPFHKGAADITVECYARKAGTETWYKKWFSSQKLIQQTGFNQLRKGAIAVDEYETYEIKLKVSRSYTQPPVPGGTEINQAYDTYSGIVRTYNFETIGEPKVFGISAASEGKTITLRWSELFKTSDCTRRISYRHESEDYWHSCSVPDNAAGLTSTSVMVDFNGRTVVKTLFEYNFDVSDCGQYGLQVSLINEATNDLYQSKTVYISIREVGEFSWTYSKGKDGDFNLTADEWNDFTSFINSVRNLKGLSTVNFTQAVTGQPFTAAMYKQARDAIQNIGGGAGSLIPDDNHIYRGAEITADMMNVIVDEINAVVRNS